MEELTIAIFEGINASGKSLCCFSLQFFWPFFFVWDDHVGPNVGEIICALEILTERRNNDVLGCSTRIHTEPLYRHRQVGRPSGLSAF